MRTGAAQPARASRRRCTLSPLRLPPAPQPPRKPGPHPSPAVAGLALFVTANTFFGVLFRYVKTLTPWGMMDVFLLGILVPVVKLVSIAGIVPGVSLFAFVLLIFVLATAQATLDPDIVWSRVPLCPQPSDACPRQEKPCSHATPAS